ncbi:MAG: UvrB/UvrC motif-containing protein, partial [Phycisphaerae bacterium]|nr:UvrB/UvrC motif-containing protein [Phycisphaerae bacterium]
AMSQAISETERRRELQTAYNQAHGITPRTIQKAIRQGLEMEVKAHQTARDAVSATEDEFDAAELLAHLEKQMLEAAEVLEFEKAAALRDRIEEIQEAPQIEGVPAARSRTKRDQPGMPGTRVKKRRGKKKA